MTYNTIIKSCLSNVMASCEKYKVDFSELLTELLKEKGKSKFVIWLLKKLI
ncbi:MAG: hypothetical protein ACFFG0_00435 [Candidatus Thorarchaeota archaeon]